MRASSRVRRLGSGHSRSGGGGAIILAELAESLDRVFPPRWAEPWDNVGLTIGRAEADVRRILVSLDVSSATVAEACERGCEMLLTHHPFPWREARRYDLSRGDGDLLRRIMLGNLNLFSMHTNLDAAPAGHASRIAAGLGLSALCPLRPSAGRMAKVVVYVPESRAGAVRRAMAEAGAGAIGHYTACSFTSRGEGRFTPGEGTSPAIGSAGRESAVPEERVEVVCPEGLAREVIAAARGAHPYESMAYDLWPLCLPEAGVGLGRIGSVPSMTLRSLLARTEQVVGPVRVSLAWPVDSLVERVAVCPGSAGGLIDDAIRVGAQVLIGGEFSHHDARNAQSEGLTLVDGGHFGTEAAAVEILLQACTNALGGRGVEVFRTERECDPFHKPADLGADH